MVLFSDASVSRHRDKRPIVFCTYLTNSFLARRPCWTNPPKCQPSFFRPADSVRNTRTFVFVRAGWTAVEKAWKYLPCILCIFLPFSHMPTIWGGFRQMIRCGVSTKGGRGGAEPRSSNLPPHFAMTTARSLIWRIPKRNPSISPKTVRAILW